MSLQMVDQSERATAAATIAAANSEAQAVTTTRTSAVRLAAPPVSVTSQIVNICSSEFGVSHACKGPPSQTNSGDRGDIVR